MWSKVAVRVASAVVGAAGVIALIFSKTVYFNILVCVAALIALYELTNSFSKEKKWPVVILSFLFALFIMSSLFIPGFDLFKTSGLFLVVMLYIMAVSLCAVIFNEKIKLQDILTSTFSLIYAVIFTCHLSLIHSMNYGYILIFLPLIFAWMTDTFAYIGGMSFGKHKLIEKISPNKTVEGAVSGVIGCILSSLAFAYIISFFGFKTNLLPLCSTAFILSILSQFGDLTASLIKRECKVKDFGNLIPGHGGILDRIDSVIFITPVVYYFLQIFEVIYK